MLLRLQKGLSKADLDSITGLCTGLGYRTQFLGGRDDLLELSGAGKPEHRSQLEDVTGVVAVLESGEARERSLRTPGMPDTVVAVREARFGGGNISLIAGPCAVEDPTRLLEIAGSVRRAGAVLLRGGAFKPRSSPYSFQGLGQEGLDHLQHVKAETGLGVVTEVLDPREVQAVADVADMFQIGARSMTNFALLKEIG